MTTPPTKKPGRKLLVAAIGVATVSYVAACGSRVETSGNLVPPPDDAATDGGDASPEIGPDVSSGNLVPPPDTGPDTTIEDTSADDVGPDVSSGNLVPPPDDAGLD